MTDPVFDPELDLVLERLIDVPPHLVWRAWTEAEQLKQWFTPAPWKTADAELDVRPGGRFRTVMESPEGEQFPNDGCYLEVVEHERLVFTDALLPGYRPSGEAFFTCVLTLKPEGAGTRYRAVAMHGDPEKAQQHREMGFLDGWGTALDQLVAFIKSQ
jgi:uncharacterized protein YndB with AHSA1/START domain